MSFNLGYSIEHKGLISALIVLVIVGLMLSACGRIQSGQSDENSLLIELALEPVQPAVGPANLIFTLTDSAGQPVNNATLEVEGNMTHAGMTPVVGQVTGGENGRYAVPFEWTMGGDWIVTVNASLENGQQITRQFPVSVGGAGPADDTK